MDDGRGTLRRPGFRGPRGCRRCSAIASRRGLGHEIGEEGDEVLRPGRVGDPAGDGAVVDVEGGEQLSGAVTAVLELATHRDPHTRSSPSLWAGMAGRVGLIRLLAWIPVFSSSDHTMHCPVGSNTGRRDHRPSPRTRDRGWSSTTGFATLEIERPTDPPRLRRRDRHPFVGHPGRQRVHRPGRRPVRC